MTKISRRDFLRTFAAIAAVGTMDIVPVVVAEAEVEKVAEESVQADVRAREYDPGPYCFDGGVSILSASHRYAVWKNQ